MALNDFTQYALENISITNPTSIEFGPDGRLYVTQQNGLIKALEIQKKPEGGYTVVSEESITLVQDMPNHNDDGSLAAAVHGRQVTGVVTTTNEAGQVVLYVSSSDVRIAGGASGDDSGLDTNSGTISRLTLTPTGWEKVDIVRGLPRSEENHSVNGMQITQVNGVPTLLVTVGGNTNQGAQSHNFSQTNEYYYSASIIAVDLAKIGALEAQGVKTYAPSGFAAQKYIFDLPTLDDPTRPNGTNGADLAESGTAGGDPFGGNDGLNQAIYDPSGVVKVYSSGYRNIYDVVVTQDGKLYTYDNGPNSGWGGIPVNANGQVIVDANGDGVPDNGPGKTMYDGTAANNAGTSKPDQLHLIDPTINDGPGTGYIDGTPYNSAVYLSQGLGYYGGHPNLTRAYGTQAGLYLYSETGQPLTIVNGELVVSTTGPVDLGPMIANWNAIVGTDGQGNEFIDPRQAIYLSPKPNDGNLPFDGSLHSIGSSTNGLTEYLFNGSDLNKALLTVSFNGNLTALILDAQGKVIGTQTRGIGGNPLDVTSQKDGEIFGGTIWVATHGSDKIFILDPDSGTGIIPDPTDRDVDDVEDTFDPFAADPDNGLDNVINANETLTWEFISGAPFPNQGSDLFDGATGLYNGFDIGFTGIMTDGTGLPEAFYDPQNLIAGGAPGAFQIKKVEAGDPFANTLRGGYQFGIVPGGDTGVFTVTTQMDSYFDEISGVPGNAKLLQGLFVGSGDMDNFVYIAAVRQANGTTGIEVAWEFEQPFQPNATGTAFYQIDALGSATSTDYIKVSLAVDSVTGIATPKWEYTSGGQTFTQDNFAGPIASVQLAGQALEALHGQNALDMKSGGTAPSGFAVGILASNTAGGAVEGNVVAAVNAGGNDYTAVVNGQTVTFLSDKAGGAANPWVTGAYKSFAPTTTFDIQGTDLDTLHLSERSQVGTWGYAVPVSNGGTYDLDLYFSEIYFGAPGGAAGGIGKREFKVKIEGQYVDIPGLADGKLDIYELVGAANELILSYDITENANDGNSTLDIQFETVTNQAKLSGFIVREASSAPTFAADWENISVTGQPKDLSSDLTPPTVSLSVIPAPADDAQFQVTVVFTDSIAMNADSVQAGDLTMAGPSGGELVHFEKTVSADGKTVTGTYFFAPVGGTWQHGSYSFQVGAGATQDAAGNGNALASASVPYGGGNEELEKGELVLAVNFNGPAVTTEDGITYQADEDNNADGTAWIGSHKVSDGQFSDIVQPVLNTAGPLEEQLYKTQRYGGKNAEFSYTISNLQPNTTYVLTLKFAEIWHLNSSAGMRVFDVSVNGTLVMDNLDLFAQAGMHVAYDKDLLVTTDAEGKLKISMPATVDNGQIAALALHETPGADTQGPTGQFTVAAPQAPNDALVVTVAYTDASGVNGSTIDANDLLLTGASPSSVAFSYDPATSTATYTFAAPTGGWSEGDYSVQLVGGQVGDTANPPNNNAAGAAQNFTVDFPGGPAPGYAPAQDLDGDQVANKDDPDVDGDGVLNGADPFHYDSSANGHGMVLADGQVLLLNFNTVGTAYQNGLTGLMLNPNGSLDEETGTAKVENGKLVINATNGDYRLTDNSQKDAYLTGVTRDGGFIVETSFAVPDFNPGDANPDTPAVDFQSLGVAVSLDQNNVVKLVFGNNGAQQFQLIHESNALTQAGQKKLALPSNIAYADIADIKLTLEIVVNEATNAVSAIANAVLLAAGGSQLASLAIGTVPVVGALAAAIIDPSLAVGAGVVQTSFSGKPQFTAAYDYLKVTGSGGGVDQPPTVAQGIAAQAATEDQIFVFTVPGNAFADDAGLANLALSATLADGSMLPLWLTFDPVSKTFTGTPANENVGAVDVKVVAADSASQTAETTFQLTVANTNDAPTAIALGASTVSEHQPGAVIGAVQVTDPDVGDTCTYEVLEGAAVSTRFEVTAAGQLKLKAGVSLDADVEPTVNVTLKATDSAGAAFSQGFTINVASPADAYAPGGDLDLDGILNSSDTDIDGDGLANGDDTFAYDSDDDGHGILMAAGQVILLDFGKAGSPYQNGFTGVMASSNPAFKTEDTGLGSVSGGKLHVTTTSGDTGPANSPQNNYQLGIKNGSFTVEGVFDNPYSGTGEVPNNFEQLGLQISVHSDAFAKIVIGSPGANIEFSQEGGTPIKTSFANGKTLSDFAQAKLEMSVSTVGTTSTATATITLLDANGNTIPGGGPTVVGTLTLSPALAAALQDGSQAVGVGVTSTHIGGDAFTWSVDNFQVKEGAQQPPAPSDAEEILSSQTDLVTTDTYPGTAVGAAVLKVLPGNNNVQTSNFGNNSFMLENVGDKKIAGVFIDVSSAIYGDSVFDDDGSGGDSVFKDIAYQTNTGTGAISPTTYGHFFYPARNAANPDPLYANALSDSGMGADGGYRGLMLKFSNSEGGFQKGEQVGFSGDMDPNSIAGLLKSTVDSNSVPVWDVGGVSGAELIGSRLTIMFTDGTMANGQLMSDGSQAGAQALITQSTTGSGQVAGITVNGVQPGETGTYGGDLPDVIVTGPPGATVRVVMTRGFDPVESQKPLNGGATTVDDLVEDRLAAYDFKANNAADFQTVDVVIPASGSIDVSQMFKYNTAPNNFTGIPNYNQLPVGFVAAVINPANGGLPAGAVTEPVYLQNNGTPVPVDGTGPVPSTYYQMVGNRLKVQVEDVAGGGNPPAGWVFQNDADGGLQTGFQGSGYYYWKSETGTAVNAPEGAFTATFLVETAGTYTLRARSSRDSNSPSGERNDVWVKVDNNTEALLAPGTADIVSNSGYVKLYGASTGWGFSSSLDTVSDAAPNVAAKVNLSAGYHTITFAGRSQGYHLDYFELYQGSAPAVTASNSPLVTGGASNAPPTDIVLSNQSVTEEQAGAVIGNVTVVDPNVGNTHTLTVNDSRFEVVGGQLKLKAGTSLDFEAEPSVSVVVTATDNGGLSLSETFVIGVTDDPNDGGSAGTVFTATVVNANGDIEQGSSITSADLETNKVIGIQFTVPAGTDLAAGDVIESAVISWVSDRTHTASSTLTFAVESKLNGAALSTGVTNRSYLPETEVWNASGTWTDGQEITVGIDLANQLNALIQSGGLQAGDVITVKVTGAGGTRYVEAAGGGRSGPELTITVAEDSLSALTASSEKLSFGESAALTDLSSPQDGGDGHGLDLAAAWFDADAFTTGETSHDQIDHHDSMNGQGSNDADYNPFIA